MKHIVHLTSVHQRYDTRVFNKMCSYLATHDYNISLVVSDGKGDEVKNGVSIIDVGPKTGGRFSRITKTVNLIYKKTKELNGDLFHLHDPELIPIGLKLKKLHKRVVFDAHEDYIGKIESKQWIHPSFRKVIFFLFKAYYNYSLKKLDGVVLASRYIQTNNPNKVTFRNLPNLSNKNKKRVIKTQRKNIILYTGGITKYRGIEQVIKAMLQSSFKNWQLVILGSIDLDLKHSLKKELKDKRIIVKGEVSYDEVIKWIYKSRVGVVVNQPVFTYDKALPNKLFEYMAYGLPVVCSHYPHWQEIVAKNKVGLCCDPRDLKDIAHSIEKILSNDLLQKSMSSNGERTIENFYNLEKETLKLIDFYKEICQEKIK